MQKRGGRDSSAIPTKRPGRLSYLARPLRAHGPCHCALSRCPKKVDQAGRQGLVGIIWLFFSRYWHLERRREPSQRLVKPMDFSRTHVTSRPERARENQGKRARTKFSDGGSGMGSDPYVKRLNEALITYHSQTCVPWCVCPICGRHRPLVGRV